MVGKFGSIDGRSLQFYLFPYSFLLDNLCFRSKVMIICVVSSIRVRQWLFYIWLPYDNELMLTKARMISINILYSWWSQMFDMNWCYNIANCVLRCHVFVSYCCCVQGLFCRNCFFLLRQQHWGLQLQMGSLLWRYVGGEGVAVNWDFFLLTTLYAVVVEVKYDSSYKLFLVGTRKVNTPSSKVNYRVSNNSCPISSIDSTTADRAIIVEHPV